ncbi:hypothetical protein [Actinacidiphila sp. ITFR-21]|uniref:hypothetical protein n=1 Tax=Actinacidiphila sp. ITFR-21 TaxID=3075199 RepID=UPI0028891C3F|nr:hypothetical protein [Streptomyces sp. ITFR-21]WNI20094.1 hypothetical protein RLT57_31640 [Streptomyces sp. ITFR-21]
MKIARAAAATALTASTILAGGLALAGAGRDHHPLQDQHEEFQPARQAGREGQRQHLHQVHRIQWRLPLLQGVVNKASWTGNSFYTGGKRFNDFSILMRAEHGSTKVQNCSYGICEERTISGEVNNSNSGSKTFATGASGYGEAYVKTKKKSWTADATAYVDIADDGKGSKAWGLSGTAAVS